MAMCVRGTQTKSTALAERENWQQQQQQREEAPWPLGLELVRRGSAAIDNLMERQLMAEIIQKLHNSVAA
ncbi:hypothetical protein ACLKA7_013240 [Drosophila subpalustris]